MLNLLKKNNNVIDINNIKLNKPYLIEEIGLRVSIELSFIMYHSKSNDIIRINVSSIEDAKERLAEVFEMVMKQGYIIK